MISWLRYRYTKARMTAYLNGQLSVQSRRQIARYIDTDSRCYREYMTHRRIHDELQRQLPVFGAPSPSGLDSIWHGIQDELDQPQTRPRPRRRYAMGYGMAVLLFVLAMTLPNWLREKFDASTAMPTQPAPLLVSNKTPAPIDRTGYVMMHHAAALTLTEPGQTEALLLQNTPAPRHGTR